MSDHRFFRQLARLAARTAVRAVVVATITALVNLAFWWVTHR